MRSDQKVKIQFASVAKWIKASVYETEDCGFESHRGLKVYDDVMMNNPNVPAMIVSPETASVIVKTHKQKYGMSAGHVVCTSGGFDPLHVGHLRCLQAASMLKGQNGLLVVIVNNDAWLKRKKGYSFMPLDERVELIASLRGVDYVVPWERPFDDVGKAIECIRPDIFAKGGSSFTPIPEQGSCDSIGCALVFGIGGNTKAQSSSELVAKMQVPSKE